MEERVPWATEYWQKCDPDYCDGDGSESFSQFIERMRGALNDFEDREERKIIAFSHMLFIKALKWSKHKQLLGKVTHDDMKDFKQYLLKKTVTNCEVVPYGF